MKKMNKNTFGYVAIIIMLVATGFFAINLFFQEKSSHDKLNIAVFPHKIGEWTGQDTTLSERDYAILETRNLIFREYTNPSGEKIFLFIIYSETNRSVFHPPEVCLIGSGVEIVDKKIEEMKIDKNAFLANKLYLEKDHSKELVLYCYKAGKLYTDNFYYQQSYLTFHQIFGRRIPGATIRVSMPMKGANDAATLPVLKKFLEDTINTINKLT